MNVLIDIGHPAHVHLFKNLAFGLINRNIKVLFSVRKKEFNVELLEKFGFDFIIYGSSKISALDKILTFFKKNFALAQIIRKFKPDITISHSSFYLSQVSWFYGIPNITLEDTGNLEQIWLYLPFTKVILTPSSYHRKHGKKQISYEGFHELTYLHPNRFTKSLYIDEEETAKHPNKPIIFIRLVNWGASHDIGQAGISTNLLRLIIKKFNNLSIIVISSESQLEPEFMSYKLNCEPHEIHDFLKKITVYIGEGATMASECALLGIPTIYINSLQAGTINELENAGLLFHLSDEQLILDKTEMILTNPNLKKTLKNKLQMLLKDKIDVTSFLMWFVENYPESCRVMKKNPSYQFQFR